MRRYRVTKSFPPLSEQSDLFVGLGKPVLDWFWEGYSASVVAFGQSQTGKSYSLFHGKYDTRLEEQGVFFRIIQELYSRIHHSSAPDQYRVGISYWDVFKNDTIDVLAPLFDSKSTIASNQSFTVVQSPSMSEFMSIIKFGRANSNNWKRTQGYRYAHQNEYDYLPNRSHSFIRIALYDTKEKKLSTLHFVDMVGWQPLNPNPASTKKDNFDQDVEKRINSQQLASFSKVVTELARLDSDDVGGSRLISAKESKLTQYLGPLLAKNSKTFLLTTISPLTEDYLDTVNTLRVATRALSIATSCNKLLVSEDDIQWKLVPEDKVLGKIVATEEDKNHEKPLKTSEFLDDIVPVPSEKDKPQEQYRNEDVEDIEPRENLKQVPEKSPFVSRNGKISDRYIPILLVRILSYRLEQRRWRTSLLSKIFIWHPTLATVQVNRACLSHLESPLKG